MQMLMIELAALVQSQVQRSGLQVTRTGCWETL